MVLYSFSEVLRYTGATRSQLIHWTDTGLIKARGRESTGTGKHRAFDFYNLLDVEILAYLVQFRVPLNVMGRVLRKTHEALEWQKELLVVFQTFETWSGNRHGLYKVTTGHHPPVAMLINLWQVVDRLIEATEERSRREEFGEYFQELDA